MGLEEISLESCCFDFCENAFLRVNMASQEVVEYIDFDEDLEIDEKYMLILLYT